MATIPPNWKKKGTKLKTRIEHFESAEAAYFWAVECEKYKAEGARFRAGLGVPRPCEPADIFICLKRLYDAGRIKTDHVLTLRFFGIRGYTPDPKHYHKGDGRDERAAYKLWSEAMDLLESELLKKQIVMPKQEKTH